MPRTISTGFRYSTHALHSEVVNLLFLTISHDELEDVLRFVNDTRDYVRGGVTWTGFPFQIELLSDNETPPTATLEIQNVDTIIGETIHGLRSAPRLKLELLSSEDFNLDVDPRTEIGTAAVEWAGDKLYLTNVKLDALTVSGTLSGWDYMQRTWPGVRATQNRLPGLFR
jgi:hypothetical protein